MLEDKLLLSRLKRGDADALRRVYEKYKHDLLGLAVALCRDGAVAEDVVHDVFVSFVRFSPKLRLRTSLRSYLLSSVANRVRNLNRASVRQAVPSGAVNGSCPAQRPEQATVLSEQATLIEQAMAKLPGDQRETVILHLQGGMTFREIANSQDVSINTIQSRYRYGLEKLRSLLDGKVTS